MTQSQSRTPQVNDEATIVRHDGQRFTGYHVVKVSATGASVTITKRNPLTGRNDLPDIARRQSNGRYYLTSSGLGPQREVVFQSPSPQG